MLAPMTLRPTRKPDELITEPHERDAMRRAGRLVAMAHAAVRAAVAPGINTRELEALAEHVIVSGGGRPAFKGPQRGGGNQSSGRTGVWSNR